MHQPRALRQGEAGEAELAVGQPVLYAALRFLHGTALTGRNNQGRGRGNQPGLEDDQAPRREVHAGAVRQVDTPDPKVVRIIEISTRKGHTYRIVCQQFGAAAADLVRE